MGLFDGLFESEMRGINNRDWSAGWTGTGDLSEEQWDDISKAHKGSGKKKKEKKKSFWDSLFGESKPPTPTQGQPGQKGWLDW